VLFQGGCCDWIELVMERREPATAFLFFSHCLSGKALLLF